MKVLTADKGAKADELAFVSKHNVVDISRAYRILDAAADRR